MDWLIKTYLSKEIGKSKVDLTIDLDFDLNLQESNGRPNFIVQYLSFNTTDLQISLFDTPLKLNFD